MLILILKNRMCSICVVISVYLSSCAQQPGRELKFNTDGKFKIVQFTDIHLENGSSNNDKLIKMISNILIIEQPEIVILTGDIITTKHAKRGWQTIVKPFIERKIPWAVTLGNHDDEYDLNRTEIISLLKKLPYSLVQSGPKDIGGSGNYVIEIKDSKGLENVALLYCLDSNAYTTIEGVGEYGWFKFEQVEWFRQQSSHFRTTNDDTPISSVAFFHIPVPEYKEIWESSSSTCIGTKNEDVCAPAINTGMFAAMREAEGIMGVFVGHDHDNDYAGCLHSICLAYGRVTGFDAYGTLPRGARVIELLEGKREFNSWIRTEYGKILNRINFPKSFEKCLEISREESEH